MTYCTEDEVITLFGDLSDDVPDDLMTVAIDNSTVWIDSNLKRHYVPVPSDVPETLLTVAVYYAASDIILSLYHGEDLPVQYDIWFQKAQDLLDDYIYGYLNSDASDSELNEIQMVKYSHSSTYHEQRRKRRRFL